MTTTTSAPAGWYPDQAQQGNERYWNGQQWTDQVRQAQLPTQRTGRSRKTSEAKAAVLQAKADAKAARDAANAQAKAERDAANATARSAREAAQKETAFRASPVGQAVTAREQAQGFFEIQLVVGESQRDSTLFGGNNTNWSKNKKVTHAGLLSAIEAVGWRLEHVGYIYQVTSESSRDKFLASGQQIAVSGRTIGIYLFRAA
ncbi:MAG: hypothetical protein QOG53_210 [Frankiales bacterium]|jgi:hypothetical protein|nr:hypothetical protein [Frankiales bacterium]